MTCHGKSLVRFYPPALLANIRDQAISIVPNALFSFPFKTSSPRAVTSNACCLYAGRILRVGDVNWRMSARLRLRGRLQI
jgi:hypothetical protein